MKQMVTIQVVIESKDPNASRCLAHALSDTLEDVQLRQAAIDAVQQRLVEGADLTVLRVHVGVASTA